MDEREDILNVIENTVGVDIDELKMESYISANDIDEVDFVNMIMAIEEKFNIILKDIGFEDLYSISINDFIERAKTEMS